MREQQWEYEKYKSNAAVMLQIEDRGVSVSPYRDSIYVYMGYTKQKHELQFVVMKRI